MCGGGSAGEGSTRIALGYYGIMNYGGCELYSPIIYVLGGSL